MRFVLKGLVSVAAMSAALIATSAVSPSGAPAKANGEIIGIVEMGSTRVGNAVVSITEASGSFLAPTEAVDLDQKDKEFMPHVLAILKGTTVKFKNSDPYLHNVFSNSRVKMFNVSQAKKGDTSEMVFDKVGIIPIKCHIHANMKGYIVVLANPYFAVTNDKGQFQIGNVPPGTYTLKVWTDHTPAVTQSVEVTAGGRAKAIFKVTE